MIEGNSCATFVKTRSRSLSLPPSLLKGRGIFYFRFSKRFSPATFSSEILPTMIPPYSLPPNLP